MIENLWRLHVRLTKLDSGEDNTRRTRRHATAASQTGTLQLQVGGRCPAEGTASMLRWVRIVGVPSTRKIRTLFASASVNDDVTWHQRARTNNPISPEPTIERPNSQTIHNHHQPSTTPHALALPHHAFDRTQTNKIHRTGLFVGPRKRPSLFFSVANGMAVLSMFFFLLLLWWWSSELLSFQCFFSDVVISPNNSLMLFVAIVLWCRLLFRQRSEAVSHVFSLIISSSSSHHVSSARLCVPSG